MSAEEQFVTAIERAGLHAPTNVVGDGKLHRFSSTGRRGDAAGWYVLHLDGVPAGAFGDWRSGASISWCIKADADLRPTERRVVLSRIRFAQLTRQAETAHVQEQAAATATAIWAASLPAIAHPYLTAKQVRAHGLRMQGNNLLVPLRDMDGTLRSLQTIAPDGTKRFLPGGRVRGCYHFIGGRSDRIIVCEGYATAATLYEATGNGIAVAFSASNLEPVALAVRGKFGAIDLIVAADDDWKTHGNPGLTAARRAARLVGAALAVPSFAGLPRGDKDTDYNDVARLAAATDALTETRGIA